MALPDTIKRALRPVKRALRPVKRAITGESRLDRAEAHAGLKGASAMMRVKNEEDLLSISVRSIIDFVDEVVLIDNLSTDNTPRIIDALRNEFPTKVVCFRYNHHVQRIGKENHSLATNPLKRFSPSLLANYYNWCLKRCSSYYVLKWDADMVATEAFGAALKDFLRSDRRIMWVRGVNVHPNLESLVASTHPNLGELQSEFIAETYLANYMTPYTDPEPRVFPRAFARYNCGYWWCEKLQSPYLDAGRDFHLDEPGYLHLKYCKQNPYEHFSDDFRIVVSSNIGIGPSLPDELRDCVRRWL